ncbi:hypothetical protein V8D89_002904 [Ganoderma adspersum]
MTKMCFNDRHLQGVKKKIALSFRHAVDSARRDSVEHPTPGRDALPPSTFGGCGVFPDWPTYPPQPVFNRWMTSHYPMVPDLSEPSAWFEGLVTAVSKKIEDDEKKAAVDDIDKKRAALTDISIGDEKALVDALRKQKEGKLTMEQVFRELSQTYGHTDLEWTAWFFANYERLISKVDLNANARRASADEPGDSARFITPVASRTRSSSINRSSRFSTIAAVNTLTDSHEEESFTDPESELESDGSPPARDAHQLRARMTGNTKTPQPEEEPACPARKYTPVTDEDLRAMARYQLEQGDDDDVRRYGHVCWREFARRPENRKRTLAAWICIPRRLNHAAAIDRYVREYQLLAEVVECKPILPVVSPQQQNDSSSGVAGMQFGIAVEMIPDQEDGSGGSENSSVTRAGGAADLIDLIDLTCEKEE